MGKKIFSLFLFCLLYMNTGVYADSILLKNGGTLKGEIKDKSQQCALMYTKGVSLCCPLANIEKMDTNGKNEVMENSPLDAQKYSLAAEKALKENQYLLALQNIQMAIALDADNADYFKQWARIYLTNNDKASGKYAYAEALKRFPNNGEFKKALEDLEKE